MFLFSARPCEGSYLAAAPGISVCLEGIPGGPPPPTRNATPATPNGHAKTSGRCNFGFRPRHHPEAPEIPRLPRLSTHPAKYSHCPSFSLRGPRIATPAAPHWPVKRSRHCGFGLGRSGPEAPEIPRLPRQTSPPNIRAVPVSAFDAPPPGSPSPLDVPRLPRQTGPPSVQAGAASAAATLRPPSVSRLPRRLACQIFEPVRFQPPQPPP